MARILVAFYSRSGTTRHAATQIASALGADLEDIRDRRSRSGIAGYLRSAVEARLEAGSDIERATHDPAAYDLVVLGSPTWAASMASPVRSFIWQHRDQLKEVALFSTCGGRGGDRVLEQMASATGKTPVASLVLREAPVLRGTANDAVRGFVGRIERTLNGTRKGAVPFAVAAT